MADYIYTMEIRLTPDQMKGVNLVQEIARTAGITLYLTGGAIRDIISGFTIRDLDFTVQGNPLKLQKDFERAGAQVAGHDEDVRTLFLVLPGNVRAEIGMAHTEHYEKVGKAPVIAPASIQEDLRRRDFTVNAMALSLNEGSRGLLLDPFNGVADIEAKLLRILHNYSFVEDPSRLIRATRFAARFHWPLEERTQQRYNAAKENNYIEHISRSAVGHEIAQLAHEDDPLNVVQGAGERRLAEGAASALVVGQGGYERAGAADEDAAADGGPGVYGGSVAGGDALFDGAAFGERHFGFAAADSAQGFDRGVARY